MPVLWGLQPSATTVPWVLCSRRHLEYQSDSISEWAHVVLTALIDSIDQHSDSSCRLVRAASGDQAFNCWISSCRQLSKEPQTAGQIYRKSKIYNDNNVVYLCIYPNLVWIIMHFHAFSRIFMYFSWSQAWYFTDSQAGLQASPVTVGAASLAPWRRAFAALANFGDPEAFHDFHFDIWWTLHDICDISYIPWHFRETAARHTFDTFLAAVWASEWHVGNVDLFQVEDNAIAFNAILSPRLGSRLCDLLHSTRGHLPRDSELNSNTLTLGPFGIDAWPILAQFGPRFLWCATIFCGRAPTQHAEEEPWLTSPKMFCRKIKALGPDCVSCA